MDKIIRLDFIPLSTNIEETPLQPLKADVISEKRNELNSHILRLDFIPLSTSFEETPLQPLKADVISGKRNEVDSHILRLDFIPLSTSFEETPLEPLKADISSEKRNEVDCDITTTKKKKRSNRWDSSEHGNGRKKAKVQCSVISKEEKKVKQKKEEPRKRPLSMEDSPESTEEGGCKKRQRLKEKRPLPLNISNYKIHAVLGRGHYGKVMLASISSSSQFVAIKMMKKEWQRKIAISRELRILRLAAGCPFLCHSYAAFQTQLHAYMVMEYASGGSLKQVINCKGHMETDVITFYTAEIVCGLQFLHANGIVHRDIKIDNILMTGDGHIKIADFGVAVEDMFGGRKIKGRAGTLKYMAPEVLDMKAYDVGADWWSLGIVICKMASKTAPFSDGSHGDNYASSLFQDEPIFPEGLSSDLEDLLQKLLEKDPEKRLGFMENVRKHQVFNSIDWEQLERLKVPPPIQPEELTTKEPWVPLEPQETKSYSSENVTLTDFSYLSDTWGS